MQEDIIKFKRHWPGGENTEYAKKLRPSIVRIEHAIQEIINEEDEYVLMLLFVRPIPISARSIRDHNVRFMRRAVRARANFCSVPSWSSCVHFDAHYVPFAFKGNTSNACSMFRLQ